MKIEEEFKKALAQLTDKEKDKLIVRLLHRDPILTQKLYFELVSTSTEEDERNALAEKIKMNMQSHRNKGSFGLFMREIRSISGAITLHLKVTKDKLGEVSLNILLLQEILRENSLKINKLPTKYSLKLSNYMAAKLFKTLVLIGDLHEDLRADFRHDLEDLANMWSQFDFLMQLSVHCGLDLNWLIDSEIPEEIKAIYSDVRKARLL